MKTGPSRDVLDNAESARLIACHSARGERVPTSLRSRFTPLWQEVALDSDPKRQDETLDLLTCESANEVGRSAVVEFMRRALDRARAELLAVNK